MASGKKGRIQVGEMRHLSMDELVKGLDVVRRSPKDHGELLLIVSRPGPDARETLTVGQLNEQEGLAGDGWNQRPSSSTPNIEAQITLMNSRAAELITQSEERWALAGDQLYADLDISQDNLPAGARLKIGEVVIEVTATPHTGCAKFMQRFGAEALKFVNSPEGKRLRLRGLNARVISPGMVKPGDLIHKIG